MNVSRFGGQPETRPQIRPMSCSRFASVYWCECEVTKDSDVSVHLWEPLDADVPPDARPCCYGIAEIDFYDHTGNKTLLKHIRHHDMMGMIALLPDGRFVEVGYGNVVYREHVQRWFVRWLAWTNSRLARMMQAGLEEYLR